ncbi:hypothetical protein HAX54_009343 [Datura stramonium]|uniref:C2H2-type domain-containing protein n=1 Tax=Datura stramonium TaxID=4076 RepID=A0ABS8TG25_DATST|nr:hypothetical protein [Datura stramonium]
MSNRALMLLSHFNNNNFKCKTCNKRFRSFQALGGHCASHKRPRLLAGAGDFLVQVETTKNKMHKCSICGMEFCLSQALGRHMRRHRDEINKTSTMNIPILNLTPDIDANVEDLKLWPKAPSVPSPVLHIFI